MTASGLAAEGAFVIPTIDIRPYLENPTSEESARIVDDVSKACITTGFFSLVGHGIEKQLQARVLEACRSLFALPLEEKKALVPRGRRPMNRGYELIGAQLLEDGQPDQKEGYYIAQHIPASDERVKLHPELMGENIFPAGIPDAELRQPTEAYYGEVLALSLTILEILAKGLPYGDDIFDEFVSNDPVCTLRLLHYPPQAPGQEKQVGAGAHTDFGAITLLLQDSAGGLEVLNHQTGDFVPVEPNPDAYVVNIGDMLSIWTKNIYKSNVHRVINKSTKDRYSAPFFFDGNTDTKLVPFDGSKPLTGKVLTVEEHMLERFGTTYAKGAKTDG